MILACPRCANPLVGRRIEDVVVHECSECLGVFLDENAIGLIVQDKGHNRASAIVAALPRTGPAKPPTGPYYVKCPTCGTAMNRKLFPGSKIIIDVCRNHGTFFDPGELPALIEYVQSGEMERQASKRTVERVVLEKQPESFAKQLALARRDRAPVETLVKAEAGVALVELLFALF